MTTDHGSGSSQFALLAERRFAPFFWTQFLGAFNDNLFKFAFTVMVTFHAAKDSALNPALVVNLIAGLFILPFLLFSATCGQIADKYDKRKIAIFVKTLEVGIMVLAGYGFIARSVPVLLACTFLMGLHSTIFGPVKYAFLPQALTERELTGGNAMVEMGTFVAILVGNLVGGVLVGMPENGPKIAALGCVVVALLGRATVHFMQSAPPLVPNLEIKWNPFSETVRNLKLAAENIVVFRGLMGVSWLWFFGASFLTQLPALRIKFRLRGGPFVALLVALRRRLRFVAVLFRQEFAPGEAECGGGKQKEGGSVHESGLIRRRSGIQSEHAAALSRCCRCSSRQMMVLWISAVPPARRMPAESRQNRSMVLPR